MAQNSQVTETSPDSGDLNQRQSAFVEAFLTDGNATQAAIKAGYSPRSASSTGYDLLQNPRIRAALRGRQQKRAQMADVNAASVLRMAQRLAFYDARELFDANGQMMPVHALPDDIAAAVQGLEVEQTPLGQRVKYKLADKGAGVDRLMRHLGMYGEDNRQGADAVSQMLAAIHGQGSRLPLK
jgi:phage terminase small subunit